MISEEIGQGIACPHGNAARSCEIVFGHSPIDNLIVRADKGGDYAIHGGFHLPPIPVIDKRTDAMISSYIDRNSPNI